MTDTERTGVVLNAIKASSRYSSFLSAMVRSPVDPRDWGYPHGTEPREIQADLIRNCADKWAEAAKATEIPFNSDEESF